MNSSRRTDVFISGGLLLLSTIPVLAGAVRLDQLVSHVAATPENARFVTAPAPVVLHIVAASIYAIGGALQLAPHLRRIHPHGHRALGALLIPCGFVVALTALWMTQRYPVGSMNGPHAADYDGRFLYLVRLLVGAAMLWCLSLGVAAIVKRDFRRHGTWMIRAYALAMGAGTQVLTHIPWMAFPEIRGELARAVSMVAGWAINIAVAEWVIARDSIRRSHESANIVAVTMN
jgi:hypothetical protein